MKTARWNWSAIIFSLAAATLASACSSESPATIDDYLESHGANEAIADLFVRVEESVRSCMDEHGHPYIPYLAQHRSESTQLAHRSYITLDANDGFTSHYGYGIVDSTLQSSIASWNDPNPAHQARLSRGDQNRYSSRVDACRGKVDDETLSTVSDFQIELWSLTADLDNRILLDSRVAAEIPRWSDCMEARGWSFSSLEAPYRSVLWKMQAIWAADERSDDSRRQEAPGRRNPFELDESQEAMADELQAEEIALAMADAECREKALPFFDDVRRELEAQFIVDNAAFLDAYVDAIKSK